MARQAYQEQLLKLNGELIEMGDLCEEAMSLVMKALREKDEEIAVSVHKIEQKIDQKERDIEAMCMTLLLRQQPVSGDLRSISSALRMIADMERIGDHGEDISELTIRMAGKPYLQEITDIEQMATEATKMVTNSVDAYVNRDITLAREVIAADDIVDDLFDRVKLNIIEELRTGTSDGEQATDLLMVAKYFERIGDHATNIAGWVIFSLTGEHE